MINRTRHQRLISTALTLVMVAEMFGGVFSIPVAQAAAGIFRPISYQGKVTSTGGVAIANGSYNMRFKMFSAASGGVATWTETWDNSSQRVTMTGGLFSVLLGTHVTMTGSVNFNTDSLYLQVEFDPGNDGVYEETFNPRRRFASVPYAHNANTLDGLDASQFVRKDQAEVMSGTLTIKPNDPTKVGADIVSTAGAAATAALKLSTQGANHIVFGTGAANYDTNLYRSAVGTLKTDGVMIVAGNMSGKSLSIMSGNPSYILGDVGIGKSGTPKAKLDVLGTISGSSLTINGSITNTGSLTTRGTVTFRSLTGCAALVTNSSGVVSCGTPTGTFGSGNVITIGDGRYVNTSGDTMTGALNVRAMLSGSRLSVSGNANVTGALMVRGNISTRGEILMGDSNTSVDRILFTMIDSAGSLRYDGDFSFDDRVAVGKSSGPAGGLIFEAVGIMSGALMRQNGGGVNYFMGDMAIGKTTLRSGQKFEVLGTISGSALKISNLISGSGGLTVRGAIAFRSLTGCSALQTDNNGVISCGSSAGTFGSGNVITIGNQRYVSKQGDTMTGALTIQNGNTHSATTTPLLNVRGTISGALIRAQKILASSGTLIVKKYAGTSTGNMLEIDTVGLLYDGSNKRVGIGVSLPSYKLHMNITDNSDGLYIHSTAAGLGSILLSPDGTYFTPSTSGTNRFLINNNMNDGVAVFAVDTHSGATGSGMVTINGGLLVNSANATKSFFQVKGGTDNSLLYVQASSDRVGIGTSAPKAKLDVLGTISGSALHISNLISGSGGLTARGAITFRSLTSCASLQTSSTGLLSCGSAGSSFGSGNVITIGDGRYVNTSGDTMTGALTINVTGGNAATLGLKVINTMSGARLVVTDRAAIGTSVSANDYDKLLVSGYENGGNGIQSIVQNTAATGAGNAVFAIYSMRTGTSPTTDGVFFGGKATGFAQYGIVNGITMRPGQSTQDLALAAGNGVSGTAVGPALIVKSDTKILVGDTSSAITSNPLVAQFTILPTAANVPGLIIGNQTAQSANLLELRNSSTVLTSMSQSGWLAVNRTAKAKVALEVTGTISGSALTINGSITNTGSLTTRGTITFRSLTGCAALVTNSSGVVSCGTPSGTFGSGNVITIGNQRYVSKQGDTMTGALVINVAGGTRNTLGLRVINTLSGAHLHAEQLITSSGAGIFTGNLTTKGTLSGNALTVSSFPATRIPFMGAGGSMTTSANMTWNGNQLDLNSTGNTGFRTYVNGGDGWYFYNGAGGTGNFGMYDIDAGRDRLTLLGDSSVRIGNEYAVPDIHIDTSRNVAIGKSTNTIKAKLDVLGTISGSQLVINGSITNTGSLTTRGTITFRSLTGCAALVTNSSGVVSCGTPSGTFGSGNVITIGNQRYVSKQGDTMTGALTIQNGNTHSATTTPLLNVRGTMSGRSLWISGSSTAPLLYTDTTNNRVGIGIASPGAKVEITQSVSDAVILRLSNAGGTNGFDFTRLSSNGALSIQGNQSGFNDILLAPTSGNVGIGKTSPSAKLDVVGTISGSALHISNLISGSGGLTARGAITFRSLTSCTSLQTSSTGLLSCGSGGSSFGSGNVITIGNQRYVSKQGDTMTGALVIQNGNTHSATAAALLNVRGTMSGRSLYISGTGSSALFMTNITTGRVGIGTSAPKAKLDVAGVISGSSISVAGSCIINVNGTTTGCAFNGSGSIARGAAVVLVTETGATRGFGGSTANEIGSAIVAAKNAANAKDTIFVYASGTLATNLLKDGVNWWFAPNTVVTYTGTASMWDDSAAGANGPVVSAISGFGTFVHRYSGIDETYDKAVFNISNNRTYLTVTAQEIHNYTSISPNNVGILLASAGTGSFLIHKGIYSESYDALLGTSSNGTLFVKTPKIVAGDDGVEWGGSTLYLTVDTITVYPISPSATLNLVGGTVYIDAKELLGNVSNDGATAVINAQKMDASPISAAVVVNSATLSLKVDYCNGCTINNASTLYINGGTYVKTSGNVITNTTGTTTLKAVTIVNSGAGNDLVVTAGTMNVDAATSYNRRKTSGTLTASAFGGLIQVPSVTKMAVSGSLVIGETVSSTTAKATLDVKGMISGSALHISNLMSGSGGLTVRGAIAFRTLTGCSALQTDSNGVISCGSGAGTFGSGNVITIGNQRYVSKQGDTMTGALVIAVTGGNQNTLGLRVINTMSGAIVQATKQLRSSGTLITESGAIFDGGTLFVDAAGDRIGMGTLQPLYDVHVEKDSTGTGVRNVTRDLANTGSAFVEVRNADNAAATLGVYGPNYVSSPYFTSNGALSATNGLFIYSDSGVSSGGANSISFMTGGNDPLTQIRMVIDSSGRVSIGKSSVTSGQKFEVLGTISGSALKISNLISGSGGMTVRGAIAFRSLTSCTTLQTDSNGVLSCGSGGGSFGSGNVITIGNQRYVSKQGDTMTGALVIQNGNTHSATAAALLNVRGTMSGRSLYISGTGSSPLFMTNITTGRVGIGTSAPKTALDVIGTISGSALRLNGDAIVRMTSTSASGVVINGLAGQASPFLSFRNAAGFPKLQVDAGGYLRSQTGVTVISRANAGSFGGDFTFTIKRDGTNNQGNGAMLKFTDGAVSAYIKWISNSSSQNVMDLEFHNANGLNMSMPNAGGVYFYNPVQNSQDISIVKVPTQTLYPGGGTWANQATFKLDPMVFAGTSPLTVTRAAQLYIRSAPIRGGNMTFDKSTAAQFDTGGSNYRGLIIRGGNSQSGSLMEFTNTGHTILSAFTASGYLALGGQNVKKTLVLEAYGTMSGRSLHISNLMSGSGGLTARGAITFRSLTSCTVLQTDSNGVLSCGSGGTGSFGSGNVITIGDGRYVNTSGDTMTGALTIQNGNTHAATTTPLLNVRGTMSGRSLYITGTGGSALVMTNITTGRVGIGTSAPKATLDVVGTISGAGLAVNGLATIRPSSASTIGLQIIGAPSQASNFLDVRDSSNGLVFAVDPSVTDMFSGTGPGLDFGSNAVKINTTAGVIDFTYASGQGMRVIKASVFGTDDAFFQAKPGASGYAVFEGYNGAGTIISSEADPILFAPSRSEAARFSDAGLFGLDTNNPGARLSVSGSTVMGGNGNTIGGRAAKATLDVLGIISGSQLIINGSITNTGSLTTRGTVTFRSLTSCTALQTDSNGVLSCGSGGTGSFGSGNVITIGDGRYVNTSGDTMTGALRINVTGGDFNTLGLRVVNTMSGAHLHAEKLLTSSGALRVEGTGNSYIMGSVGIGTVSPQQPLHVVGETDGSAIGPLLVTYAGGSAIGVALTLDATAAAGGKKFSFISTGNTAGPSGGKFAVYNGSDNRYVFLADDNGQYIAGVNQYTSLGQITSYPNSATTKGLVVRGAASQTAFLQEWQNSAGVGLAVITATGALGLGTSSPNARLAVSGATVISDRGNVVASRVAKATLDVIGSISGSSLFVANLNAASCDVKSTNGVLSCGTDATGGAGGFGSGNVITIGDGRYVNTSGDTMTGALVIQNGNTHSATATALLNVRGTMSGKQLWISGSGTSPLIYTGNGRVGIGTSSPKAPLDVIGTMSGTTVIGSYRGAFGTNNTALGTVAGVSTNSIPSFYGAAQVGGGSSTPIFDINNFGTRRFALDAYGQVYLGDTTSLNFPTFGTSQAALNFSNNLGDKQYLYNGSNASRWGFGIQDWTFAMFMDATNPGTGKFSWRNTPNSSAAASTGDAVQNLYTTGTLENIINTATAKGHIIRISSAKQTANAFEIQSGATVLTSMSQTGWLAIGKTGKAITALDVVGTVSGSILYASRTIRSSGSIVLEGMLSGATILGFGLSADCDGSSNKITWDSTTSRFKCETDQTGAGGSFGSGNVITIGDGRYVNTSGDTMTGALIIQNGNTHAATSPPLLTVRGTMSGKQLWISGSGTAPLIFTGTGRIGFGTKTPKAFMDVNGTIENGLVGYWPMDELGGSQIVDYSTSNNSGAFVGSMTRTVGRFGRALSFNGSSYVTMGAQSELAGLQVPLTLAGWFKQTNTTGNQVVYAAYTGTTTHRLWSMIRMESGVMVYYTSLANGTYQAVGTLSAPAGQWHFFSVTVSGTTSNPTATLTLNNLTQTFSLAAMSTTPDLTVPVVFGSTSLGGEYLSGLLDNFTIHNRALSRREIADLYRNNPLGNGGTMISALRIESGATLDVAGMMSGHRLTVSGNANITGALLVRGNITTRAMLSGARLTVSGNANITGALLVAGGITTRAMLSGARLTISGNANITGALLVRGNITTRGTFSGAGLVINGTSTFFGNVVPGADNRYDLGTNSVRWRHLYLSGGTLNIGTATNSGAISYRTSGAEGLMFYGKASAFASPSMFISSGGLVAIGKTSVPKAMFEVMGSMSGKSLYISGSGGFAGLVSDVRSGKIGIGTADPKDLLHMIGANRDSQIYFQTRTVGSGGGGGSSSGPNNPGTLASDNSFGTVAWGSTSNAASQNDTYSSLELSTGQDSQYLKATNFGFSIPSNATIAGITVEVDKKADATTVSDTRARIVKGGAIGTTDKSVVGAWTTVDNDTYSSYGGSSDLWSDTWTYTDINDSTFGFALAAHFACDDICLGGAPNTFVDHIRITVAYTTGGATPIYGDWIMGSDYDDSGNFKLIQSGATMRTVMEVASGGLVGIGTGTSLTAKMTIYTDNGLNQPGLIIQSAETTSTQDMFRIRTNYSTTNNAVYRITASGATYADAPYNSAGADYAEYFPSNPQTQILAGEAVCLDTTKPNMVKRCEREADPNIIGIRSTKPSVVGNAVAGKVLDGLGLPVPGYTLVGLIGQLEARAIVASSASGSTVTGALVIKPGDSLTSASKRGYLRKAMPGESTVGVALTGLASGEGEVRVLIARTNTSNLTDKIDAEVTAHIGALKVDDKIKASLEETLSASSFDARISSAVTTQLSALQPMQDRVSTLEETILSLDNQLDALSSQLSGALLNGVGTSNPTGSNLTLTGSLAANALSAEETLAVGRDARIGGDLYLEGALIMTGDMNLSGNVTTGKLTAASGSQIAGTFTVAGDLLVAKNLTFQTGAVLTARQLLLSGALIVRGPITIEGLATFLGDVQVKGELIVSSRQAGFAIIDVGQKEITVRFEPPFKATPVVTATSDAFTLWRVKASSMTGFTLEIQSIATEKMKFSWQALTVETPMTVSGTFLAVPEGQTLFPLDAQGVPLSTSAIWNACIRHQQPLDPVTGQPFSCSRYTPDLYIWNHPDFPGMTFVWNDSYDPPLLILPDGYVGQKMTMSSSSSSTDTGTGSSISSSSESSASSDSSASSESSSSDSSSSDSSDSSSSDSSESSESSDSSSSDSSSSDSSSSDASSSDSSSSESSSSEGSSSSQ